MADLIRNGKAYDSADVEAFINGVPINIAKISYGNEQEHQLNYTLGSNASSWSKGKITPSATIDLFMHDSVPLEMAAKNGDLLQVKPFDIVVTFANEYNIIVVDKILAKFKNTGRDVTGDMGLQKSYDLFALDVKLNIAL
ncbi:MAG: hypothetical protein U1C58_06275 [Flavobacteriaceae bacterium]|nr:hypothetical protein [Flavobacteriaceae bacterium]